MVRKKSKYSKEARAFTKEEIKRFYLYAFVVVKDEEITTQVLEVCFDRWKSIPREFLKIPEIYFYQLIRKNGYSALGLSHKEPLLKTTNIFDIGFDNFDKIQVKFDCKFIESFWSLEVFSREILYFWAHEGKSLEMMSKVMGRTRKDVLAQMENIKTLYQGQELSQEQF